MLGAWTSRAFRPIQCPIIGFTAKSSSDFSCGEVCCDLSSLAVMLIPLSHFCILHCSIQRRLYVLCVSVSRLFSAPL
jgi:hypothetical protein